ncbi:hypothetical protein OUZ56_032514 [Daphnia magna]|uniref:Glycosyltransferase RgtA/B/C/D-like domain-containing protein n=1 Tax=Daphnia magna TaxID=35525 RepID=A0ABR0B945_9CRUS|nr:hypothetical protein OUZ56_032514 [Daphnia magna]
MSGRSVAFSGTASTPGEEGLAVPFEALVVDGEADEVGRRGEGERRDGEPRELGRHADEEREPEERDHARIDVEPVGRHVGHENVHGGEDRERHRREERDLLIRVAQAKQPAGNDREARDREPGVAVTPLGPEIIDDLPGGEEQVEVVVPGHLAARLERMERHRIGGKERRRHERQKEREPPRHDPTHRRDACTAEFSSRMQHIQHDDQAGDEEREDVRVPGRDGEDGHQHATERSGLGRLGLRQDQKAHGKRDRERVVEHPHRDEPVVDHREEEQAADQHPAAGIGAAGRGIVAAEGEQDARKDERVRREDQRSEELRRHDEAKPTADDVEERKQRRVRLQVAVRDKLGPVAGVALDGHRREVVRQVLEGGDRRQEQRRRRSDEKDDRNRRCKRTVRRPRGEPGEAGAKSCERSPRSGETRSGGDVGGSQRFCGHRGRAEPGKAEARVKRADRGKGRAKWRKPTKAPYLARSRGSAACNLGAPIADRTPAPLGRLRGARGSATLPVRHASPQPATALRRSAHPDRPGPRPPRRPACRRYWRHAEADRAPCPRRSPRWRAGDRSGRAPYRRRGAKNPERRWALGEVGDPRAVGDRPRDGGDGSADAEDRGVQSAATGNDGHRAGPSTARDRDSNRCHDPGGDGRRNPRSDPPRPATAVPAKATGTTAKSAAKAEASAPAPPLKGIRTRPLSSGSIWTPSRGTDPNRHKKSRPSIDGRLSFRAYRRTSVRVRRAGIGRVRDRADRRGHVTGVRSEIAAVSAGRRRRAAVRAVVVALAGLRATCVAASVFPASGFPASAFGAASVTPASEIDGVGSSVDPAQPTASARKREPRDETTRVMLLLRTILCQVLARCQATFNRTTAKKRQCRTFLYGGPFGTGPERAGQHRSARVDRARHAPWWSDPELRIRFFRPLSSLLLWADHHLLGERPLPLHLHSFLWWLAAVFATHRLLGALFRDRTVVRLATIAFAVAPCHVLPLAWLANREALVALALGTLALSESVHYAKGGEFRRLLAAGAAFCAALLAGEYALCLLGYVAAPLLLAKGRRKLSILSVFALPTVATLLVRRRYGYGSHGSGFYADPLDAPALFANHAPRRALVLGLEGWLGLDGETLPSTGYLPVLLFLFVAAALIVAPATYRAVRALPGEERRSASALIAGAFLAMIPVLAVIPSPRLLGAAQLGISLVTALVAAHYWGNTAEANRGSALATTLVAFVAFVHAPVTSTLDGLRLRTRTTQFLAATPSLEPPVGHAPRALPDARPVPPCTCTSPGEQSLELVYPRGPIVGSMNLFRDGSKPLHTGETFAAPGIHITVLSEDPGRVRFDFDAPLDRDRFWANEAHTSFEAVTLPEVGFGVPLH